MRLYCELQLGAVLFVSLGKADSEKYSTSKETFLQFWVLAGNSKVLFSKQLPELYRKLSEGKGTAVLDSEANHVN